MLLAGTVGTPYTRDAFFVVNETRVAGVLNGWTPALVMVRPHAVSRTGAGVG